LIDPKEAKTWLHEGCIM